MPIFALQFAISWLFSSFNRIDKFGSKNSFAILNQIDKIKFFIVVILITLPTAFIADSIK